MIKQDYVRLLQQAAQDIIWRAEELMPNPENRKSVTVSIILEAGSIPIVRVTQDVMPPSVFRTYCATLGNHKAEGDSKTTAGR